METSFETGRRESAGSVPQQQLQQQAVVLLEEELMRNVVEEDDDELSCLPPGFRFHPTDEEIIVHYLRRKVADSGFVARAIGEADLNKCEPWDLPRKSRMGDKLKEWWFFCRRDRKYPTGMRTNRATESGYWKATGKDKEIFQGRGSSSSTSSSRSNYHNVLVGMKKTLVFYRGRAPRGQKSNWIMHEFRLEGTFSFNHSSNTSSSPSSTSREDWVVCRVFHKATGAEAAGIQTERNGRTDSFVDNLTIAAQSPSSKSSTPTTTLPPPPPLTDYYHYYCYDSPTVPGGAGPPTTVATQYDVLNNNSNNDAHFHQDSMPTMGMPRHYHAAAYPYGGGESGCVFLPPPRDQVPVELLEKLDDDNGGERRQQLCSFDDDPLLDGGALDSYSIWDY